MYAAYWGGVRIYTQIVSLGTFLQSLNTPLKVYRIPSVSRPGDIPLGDREYFSAQFSRKCKFFLTPRKFYNFVRCDYQLEIRVN